MAYTRAEIVGPGQPFKIVHEEIPSPASGKVRVKVAFTGVCHSDIHNSWDDLGLIKSFGEDSFRGMVLGHEISGYLEEAASDVDLSAVGLQLGDPVMVYPWMGCSECSNCKAGHTNLCTDPKGNGHFVGCGPYAKGGFQTHLITGPQNLLKVPGCIPMEIACMLPCSAGTAYASLTKLADSIAFQQKNGTVPRLLIIGAGGLGLWSIQLAKVMFADKGVWVVAADVDSAKLETAKKFGADEVVLWGKDATLEEKVNATVENGVVDAAIDYVAIESTARIAIDAIALNGTLVYVGLTGGEFKAHFYKIVLGNISIRGNRIFSMDELRRVVDLVAANKLTFPALEFHPLEKVFDVILKLKEGQVNGRAIIRF